jgi:hypothetical protein
MIKIQFPYNKKELLQDKNQTDAYIGELQKTLDDYTIMMDDLEARLEVMLKRGING